MYILFPIKLLEIIPYVRLSMIGYNMYLNKSIVTNHPIILTNYQKLCVVFSVIELDYIFSFQNGIIQWVILCLIQYFVCLITSLIFESPYYCQLKVSFWGCLQFLENPKLCFPDSEYQHLGGNFIIPLI